MYAIKQHKYAHGHIVYKLHMLELKQAVEQVEFHVKQEIHRLFNIKSQKLDSSTTGNVFTQSKSRLQQAEHN